MNLIDLLIIYLACGSPFAVYRATQRGTDRPITRLLSVAGTLLGWPVSAARALNSARLASIESRREIAVESIRTQLEATLFGSKSTSRVFDFREAFYRSAGLARVKSMVDLEPATHEIFEVTHHPSKELASRCLARRNQARLNRHFAGSQAELVEVVSDLATAETAETLTDLLRRLFKEDAPAINPSPHNTADITRLPVSNSITSASSASNAVSIEVGMTKP